MLVKICTKEQIHRFDIRNEEEFDVDNIYVDVISVWDVDHWIHFPIYSVLWFTVENA